MPFYSSVSARNESQRAEKSGKTLAHVAAEAARDFDPGEDHETKPHDTYGNVLDDDGNPIEPDDVEDTDDDGGEEDGGDDGGLMAKKNRAQNRHAFGDAVRVDGHGNGGVPRAQVYDPQHPQPVDAGSLSTPHAGALASSMSANPAEVQVQQLDYRAQSGPRATFPHTGPLAQPAPHPARPTAPGSN